MNNTHDPDARGCLPCQGKEVPDGQPYERLGLCDKHQAERVRLIMTKGGQRRPAPVGTIYEGVTVSTNEH